MRSFITVAILSVAFSLPAVGQDPKQPSGDQPGVEARRAQRGQDGGERRRGGRNQSVEDRIARLTRSLDLDSDQQARLDKIVEESRQIATKNASDAEFQDLRNAMRVARDGGDEEKAEQIREQMRAKFQTSGDQLSDVLDKLEPALRPEQAQKLNEVREIAGRRPAGPRERLDELKSSLSLTKDQEVLFESLRERMEQSLPPRSGPGSMADLMRQMREARQSGDEAAIQSVREQIERVRETGRGALDDFLSQLSPTLTTEQRTTLEQARKNFAAARSAQGGTTERDAKADPRTVIRAARRLELNDQQRDQLKDIEQQAGAATREAGNDNEKKKRVAAEVEKQIRGILNSEQAAKFTELLGSNSRGQGRGQGPGQGNGERPRRKAAGAGE